MHIFSRYGTGERLRFGPLGAAILLLLLSPPISASAQGGAGDSVASGSTTELAPITVVGSRNQAVAPPVSAVEVSAEDLRRTPAVSPYDLVRRAAGIEVHEQGQGPGFASDAVIRGFTSDHSSDVLLVVDGVPINLPIHGHVEGYADWSLLSPASVSGLRVIHGPASALHGDFALGGVVEVTTAPDAGSRAAALGGSSHGDVGGWVRDGRRSQRGGFLVAFDGKREEGWRENAGYWLGNAALRGWRQAGRGRIEGGAMLYGSTWNSPGYVSVARYNAHELKAATDPTDGGSAGRLILHGRYTRPLGAATALDARGWTQGVRSRVFLNIPHDDVVSQSEEEDERVAVGGQAQVTRITGSGELTGGVSGRADWTGYDLYRTQARARTSETQASDGRYRSGGAFVRWRGLLAQRLVYDLGGRLDVLHYGSLDRLASDRVRQEKTRVLASPKLGARYLIGSRVALLGSLSRGFRGAVGVIGDPSRPPVVAWAKEVGVTYAGDRFHAQVALFQLDGSNERLQDPVTRAVSDAGRSRRRGVSLDLALTAGSGLRFIAEGTFNDAEMTAVTPSRGGIVVPTLSPARAGSPLRPSLHDVPLAPGDRVPG
ncbi:MAG: TonB-dependent receptor, partial [Gemmatimonadales bacterium]